MSLWSVLLIAVALSMDAFAVSVANGCRIQHVTLHDAVRPGYWFGGFQMLMPVLGWLGGLAFRRLIDGLSPWIAFGLLVFVGGKMIFEALHGGESIGDCDDVSRRTTREMLILAVATSIDALAVGMSFSVLRVTIWLPALIIGLTTFGFSVVGTLVGCGIGRLVKDKAEVLGGAVLIGIGIKILLQGLH